MPNKMVLLTGVAQGLGLYLCRELKSHGFNITGIDIHDTENLLPELQAILTNYYAYDLSETAGIPGLIRQIISENGNIDILINNAGIKSFRLLTEYSDDEFRKVIDVNFIAPVLLTKQLIPLMMEQQYGRIINIASNAGFEGYKTGSAYCSSKGAMHLFTQAVAAELKNNITINTISPSTIATAEYIKSKPGIEPSRFISPQQVSAMIFKIIYSGVNGKVFPVINFKSRIRYFAADLRKHLYWISHR